MMFSTVEVNHSKIFSGENEKSQSFVLGHPKFAANPWGFYEDLIRLVEDSFLN